MADKEEGKFCGSAVKRVLIAVLTLVTVVHCPRWNQSIWKAPVSSWEKAAERHSDSEPLALKDVKENESGTDSHDYSAGGNVDQTLRTLATRMRSHSTFADDAIALDAVAEMDEPFFKTHRSTDSTLAGAVTNANAGHLQEFASR